MVAAAVSCLRVQGTSANVTSYPSLDAMQESPLRRHVGLAGAVFTLVGYVIGASIFVLPGGLGARAGPALPLSYGLAGLLALLAGLAAAHIGSHLPVSSAIYVAISRNVGPRIGFLSAWAVLAAIAVGLPLVALGVAEYVAYLLPWLSRQMVALTLIAVFGVVNLLPVRASVLVQSVMTGALVVLLYSFGWQGVSQVDRGAFSPFFANGIGPALGAAVGAYFSFTGFTVIANLGAEIRNPGRILPWALGIGFVVITGAYLLVAITVVGLLDWRTLAAVPAPVATAAELFLPDWATWLVSLIAILAGVTSLHGVILVHSRDVYALARDRVLPALFGSIHPMTGSPSGGVVTLTLLGLIGVLAGATLFDYALMAVLGVLFLQVCGGVALLRMPSYSSPGRFALRGPARGIVAMGLITTSGAFALFGALERPSVAGVFGVVMVAGFLYYSARRQILLARGQQLDELLAQSLDQ